MKKLVISGFWSEAKDVRKFGKWADCWSGGDIKISKTTKVCWGLGAKHWSSF